MREGEYTISQLASAAEIPTTTLRYYERVGLIEAEDRSAGNYRLYTDDSLRKVKFIRAAQGIGFTLDDIRILLSTEGGVLPQCREVQPIIEQRLADVDQKLRDLRDVQQVLQSALKKCRRSKMSEPCCVIREIDRASTVTPHSPTRR